MAVPHDLPDNTHIPDDVLTHLASLFPFGGAQHPGHGVHAQHPGAGIDDQDAGSGEDHESETETEGPGASPGSAPHGPEDFSLPDQATSHMPPPAIDHVPDFFGDLTSSWSLPDAATEHMSENAASHAASSGWIL